MRALQFRTGRAGLVGDLGGFVLAVVHPLLEVADPLADPLADLRDLVGAEEHDDDQEDDDELRNTEGRHNVLPGRWVGTPQGRLYGEGQCNRSRAPWRGPDRAPGLLEACRDGTSFRDPGEVLHEMG